MKASIILYRNWLETKRIQVTGSQAKATAIAECLVNHESPIFYAQSRAAGDVNAQLAYGAFFEIDHHGALPFSPPVGLDSTFAPG
jgi:hypothetical protein